MSKKSLSCAFGLLLSSALVVTASAASSAEHNIVSFKQDGRTFAIAPGKPLGDLSHMNIAGKKKKVFASNLGDQSNALYISWFGQLGAPLAVAFIAPKSKTIKRIGVGIATDPSTGAGTADLAIYSDNGGAPGTRLDGQDVTPVVTTFGLCCDLTHAKVNVPATAGQQYWVVLTPDNSATIYWTAQNSDFVNYMLSAYFDKTWKVVSGQRATSFQVE